MALQDRMRITRSGWQKRAEFFRSMPGRSKATFLIGVACLFGAFGSVIDALTIQSSSPFAFIFAVLSSGICAALWAYFATTRQLKPILVLFVFQFTALPWLSGIAHRGTALLTPEQTKTALLYHHLVSLVLIIAGYVLLITFFRMEGKRYFAVYTEIQLASEIQKELVPAVSEKSGGFEFYGVSVPSGSVGGDLLDVVTHDRAFCAYIADVAGHGVPAGVLMSMVKSAVRMRLVSAGVTRDGLLPALNEVLCPLTASNTYATFAYVAGAGDSRLQFSLAGHLPIFRYCSSTAAVERRSIENLPLGMFAFAKYETGMIDCERGDLIAMVTDGLTEVFDAGGQELGYNHIEGALRQSATEPLPRIANRIIETSASYGPVTDDRTILLLRCL
jgi:serine phosphatase RsbU (regulator of sigma subunit)